MRPRSAGQKCRPRESHPLTEAFDLLAGHRGGVAVLFAGGRGQPVNEQFEIHLLTAGRRVGVGGGGGKNPVRHGGNPRGCSFTTSNQCGSGLKTAASVLVPAIIER